MSELVTLAWTIVRILLVAWLLFAILNIGVNHWRKRDLQRRLPVTAHVDEYQEIRDDVRDTRNEIEQLAKDAGEMVRGVRQAHG